MWSSGKKLKPKRSLMRKIGEIMILDNEYISRVLKITESHPDSKAVRMVELAPGVVTVACKDALCGGINSYFDMDRWEWPNGADVRGLHYIFNDKRIGTLQVSDALSEDYLGDFQRSFSIMKRMLKPVNGTTFHDEPHIINLGDYLSNF